MFTKFWYFEVLYISQVMVCYGREIKDINLYSSVFETHVKGGYCWSQIGFDKWVSTHLSYLLSSLQTSSTCRAQHVYIRPCWVIVSVEPLMCLVTQVLSRQYMPSDTGVEKTVDAKKYRCWVTTERLVYAEHQRLQMSSKIVLTYLFVMAQITM